MFGLGMEELVVIFLVIFLLFGPKALPDIAKGLAKAIRLFKKEMSEVEEAIESSPSGSGVKKESADVSNPSDKK